MSGFEVDLTNCEREPIHILGSVQPFGFLLAVNSDWVVVHASTTTLRYLGVAPTDLLGLPLTQVMSGHAIHNVRGRLQVMRGRRRGRAHVRPAPGRWRRGFRPRPAPIPAAC
ncbi:hypothetical protein ACRAWD_07630 [Caulobacter segnis]